MQEDILDSIISFIEYKMGKNKTQMSRNTCLERDLGIYGDDAVELLLDYGEKFNVDLSKFNASEYFSPEGDSILPSIIRLFTEKKETKTKELTIGDLEKGIYAGYLNEDIIG